MTLEEKQKKLDNLLKTSEKVWGKNVLMKGSDAVASGKLSKRVFKTPSLELNKALWCGGFAGIVELFGPESSGKTSLAIDTIVHNQKADPSFIAGWLETEGSITPEILSIHGVDLNRLVIWRQDEVGNAEESLDVARMIISDGTVDFLVVNSIAGLAPKKEIEDDLDKQNIALTARLMSKFFRVAIAEINKNNMVAVFINQVRENVGQMFGNPEISTSGRALGFYASQRIRMSRVKLEKSDAIHQDEGVKISCIIKKNRLAGIHNPYTKCTYYALYESGIDSIVPMPDMLSEANIVINKGAWWYYTDDRGKNLRFKSRKVFIEELRTNKALYDELQNKLSPEVQTGEVLKETQEEQEALEKEGIEQERQAEGLTLFEDDS